MKKITEPIVGMWKKLTSEIKKALVFFKTLLTKPKTFLKKLFKELVRKIALKLGMRHVWNVMKECFQLWLDSDTPEKKAATKDICMATVIEGHLTAAGSRDIVPKLIWWFASSNKFAKQAAEALPKGEKYGEKNMNLAASLKEWLENCGFGCKLFSRIVNMKKLGFFVSNQASVADGPRGFFKADAKNNPKGVFKWRIYAARAQPNWWTQAGR